MSEWDMLWGRFDNQPYAKQLEAIVSDFYERAERQGADADAAIRGLSDELAAQLSEGLTASLLGSLPGMIAEHRRHRRGFEARIEWIWGDALDLLYAVMIACQELGESFNNWHRPQAAEEQDHRFEALVEIHARACMVTSEIHALLRTGHARGAMARWRTLHELSVVASVLGDADDEISRRYLVHSAAEAYEDAQLHEEYREAVGRDPIPTDELDELRATHDATVDEFGSHFPKAWHWAAPLTAPSKPTFNHLQKIAGLEHRYPDFHIASHLLHAGSSGTRFGHIEIEGRDQLVSGPSNVGLADPGHGAAITLVQATLALVNQGRPFDYGPMVSATSETLLTLTDAAGEQFRAASQTLEQMQAELERSKTRGWAAAELLH